MIPYFPQPIWHVGSLTISAFRIAAVSALLAGYWITLWRARAISVKEDVCSRWYVIFAFGGLAGGHSVALWPVRGIASSRDWIEIWNGQSANGLAAGSLVVALVAFFSLRCRRLDPWTYLNVLAFAFPFAWTVARAGCALAHDHIGAATDSFFGVRFPSGTRFDLGFLECVAAGVLSACFFAARRTRGNVFLPTLLVAATAIRAALRLLIT